MNVPIAKKSVSAGLGLVPNGDGSVSLCYLDLDFVPVGNPSMIFYLDNQDDESSPVYAHREFGLKPVWVSDESGRLLLLND